MNGHHNQMLTKNMIRMIIEVKTIYKPFQTLHVIC